MEQILPLSSRALILIKVLLLLKDKGNQAMAT